MIAPITPPTLLWRRPAAAWTEATPVGNGAIAGMVHGGAAGLITINDATVWSGTPAGPDEALAAVTAAGAGPERLALTRDAVTAGTPDEVEQLLHSFQGPWTQEFLPLAALHLSIDGDDDPNGPYERTLDLDAGVVIENMQMAGRHVSRQVWAGEDGVLHAIVDVDTPSVLTVRLSSPLHVQAIGGHVSEEATTTALEIELPVDGAPAHEPDAPAHRWDDGNALLRGYRPVAAIAAAVSVEQDQTDSGSFRVHRTADGSIVIVGQGRIHVTVASETNSRRWWTGQDSTADAASLRVIAERRARDTCRQDSGAVLKRHKEAHSALVSGSALRLGAAPGHGTVIDVADALERHDDQQLAVAVYAYGRYLLAAASRPGSPPANLQGIWNASTRPAWSSNYTININTQMNYWIAERTGLSACHEPLLDLIDRLRETGGRIARNLYGMRGWVAHHNTDIWGWALPVGAGHGASSWAFWPMGGLWLTDHLWQRWEYTRNREELRSRILPTLLGAAEFALDWLIDDSDGLLGTNPSTSPENTLRRADGSTAAVSTSSAMDLALIRATLERSVAAAAELGEGETDTPLLTEIRKALPRLVPPRVAADGTLAEWGEEGAGADPHHRHLSHLVGLYPLHQIDAVRTPDLANAARKTLEARGDGAMGWSWAWKIALHARLGDGEQAHLLLRQALSAYTGDPDIDVPTDGSVWGGLLPNLFSTHPPVQLDGNFGLPAAIAEMLVGTQLGTAADPLRLLPSLPPAWPSGRITGIRTRGGVEVDLEWEGGSPTAVHLRATTPDTPARMHVNYDGTTKELAVQSQAAGGRNQ